jgi:hypothetical protein
MIRVDIVCICFSSSELRLIKGKESAKIKKRPEQLYVPRKGLAEEEEATEPCPMIRDELVKELSSALGINGELRNRMFLSKTKLDGIVLLFTFFF